jgi:hypothetical protein
MDVGKALLPIARQIAFMTNSHASSDHKCIGLQGESRVIAPDEARADRAARARIHASNCVILAVVTSPLLAADLIDRAVELTHGEGTAALLLGGGQSSASDCLPLEERDE